MPSEQPREGTPVDPVLDDLNVWTICICRECHLPMSRLAAGSVCQCPEGTQGDYIAVVEAERLRGAELAMEYWKDTAEKRLALYEDAHARLCHPTTERTADHA